jgi:hypothetical protein
VSPAHAILLLPAVPAAADPVFGQRAILADGKRS